MEAHRSTRRVRTVVVSLVTVILTACGTARSDGPVAGIPATGTAAPIKTSEPTTITTAAPPTTTSSVRTRKVAAAPTTTRPPTTTTTAPPHDPTTTTTTTLPVAPVAAGDPSAYQFLLCQPTSGADPGIAASYPKACQDEPVRFDPCTTIRYQVSSTGAPPGAAALVADALARIEAITGNHFEFAGLVADIPIRARVTAPTPSDVPVLIGWVPPGGSDLLKIDATGYGGPRAIFTSGAARYTTGVVVLRNNLTYPMDFSARRSYGGLLLHELGHLLGLGHSSDPSQMMYQGGTATDPAAYGAGDLTGLGRIGRAAGCLPAA